MAGHEVVLCIQDTTELDFNGQQASGLGPLSYEAQRGMYDREDYQDVAVCERYAKELEAAGNQVTVKEYKGTYHAWDGGGRRFRYENGQHSGKQCDLELQMTAVMGGGLGKNAKDLKSNREIKTFDEWNTAVRGCMTSVRARIGGDAAQSDAVVADVLKFMGVQ